MKTKKIVATILMVAILALTAVSVPTLRAALLPDPVIVAAGDIANNASNDEATAKLLDTILGTVLTLGDNAYPDGTTANFAQFYDPTWGRHKSRTQPSPGNHDYHVAGAAGYFTYFGASAHGPNGYYSYNLGAWHIVSLNSEIDHTPTSAQITWLKNDLAANPSVCTLAYWHKPRFSSGALHGSNTGAAPYWTVLYAAGVDVILNGHDHEYERFAPLNPSGQLDPKGIREFVVGTGGGGLYSFGNPLTGSEVRNNTTWGVLKMTLHDQSYDWEFVPIAGKTFTDKGTGDCTGSSVPTRTPTSTSTLTSTPTATNTETITPTATYTSTITDTPTVTETFTPSATPSTETPSLCSTPQVAITFEVPNSENFLYYVCANPLPLTPTDTPTPSPTPTDTPTATPTATSTVSPVTRIDFTPLTVDISNPERGFMRQRSIFLNQPFDASKIGRVALTDSVSWIYFRLDNFRDPRDGVGVTLTDYQGKPLDANALSVLQNTFLTARNKGLKLVIRFVYNSGPGSTSNPLQANPDVPLDVALGHIAQIKPILQENSDVILSEELGFIGHWGEWHSSKYMDSNASRSAILSASLDALPASRMVQLRYAAYREALSGTNAVRVGFYDDAFLKNSTDDGLFKSTFGGVKVSTYCDNSPLGEESCWRKYVSENTLFVPIVGEASLDNPPRTSCANAVASLATLHFTSLNNGFNTTVLNRWTTEGCMPEIRNRLGYRFELKSFSMPTVWSKADGNDFRLELSNVGFAPIYNTRPVYFVLENAFFSKTIPTTIDIRQWKPGENVSIDGSFSGLSDVPAGTYKLYLWLPDANASLQANPLYSIRMANQNVWDAVKGMNLLTSNLTIQ